MSKARAYAFTVNNYEGLITDADFRDLETIGAKYLIYQEEIGEQGTIHLQGYIAFDRPKTMKQVCDAIPGASVRAAKGTAQQNKAYCSKEEGRLGGPYEYGTIPSPGKRNDLLALKDDIDNGLPEDQLWARNFSNMTRYHKLAKVYQELKIAPRTKKPVVLLLVGPSGAGKSRFAFALAKYLGLTTYVVPPTKGGSGLRFDGYNQQDVCIIDEVDGSSFTPTFFNLLCDWYEMKVPIHGSANLQFTSPYILLCSNYLPKYWWKNRSSDQIKQTTRRIDATIPFFRRTPIAEPAAAFLEEEQPLDNFGFVTVHPIQMPHFYVQPLARFPPKLSDKNIFPL